MMWFTLVNMPFLSTETKPKIPELATSQDFDSLLAEELVVIFKHSSQCDRSWAAHAEITEFRRDQPSVPLYLVSVLDSQEVSRYIATVSGVVHQSPQVIVFRKGKMVGSASHLAVTADLVTSMIQGA